MKAEDRALSVVVPVFVVVVAGAYALSVHAALLVPAERVFSETEARTWVLHFTVSAAGAHVVGAWTAFDGYGWIGLVVLNGTVEKPWPPPLLFCPSNMRGPGSTEPSTLPSPQVRIRCTGPPDTVRTPRRSS
ncbi:MAG TPA: hypothetical protein VF992_12245 [Thermoplasmata archaeon]